MSEPDIERQIRGSNREWILTADADQLRGLALWLNAYNPAAVEMALADDEDDS